MNKPNPETVAIVFSVLVMVLAISFYVFAWTEPTTAPPGDNIAAPVNVSEDNQIKEGKLGIATDSLDSGFGLTVGNILNALGIKTDGDIQMTDVLIKGDGSISTGLNTDKLDDYDSADLLAGGGASNMPLQGNIIFRDNSANYGISTIPLTLPGADCSVKITACDYGNNPPTQMVLAAATGAVDSYGVQTSQSGWDVACGAKYLSGSGYSACGCPGSTSYYCQTGDVCGQGAASSCSCAASRSMCGPPYSADCSYSNSNEGYCCPSANPIYDPVTHRCLEGASASSTQIGNCATLTTILSGQSDISFNNSNADYIAVSYSCPS